MNSLRWFSIPALPIRRELFVLGYRNLKAHVIGQTCLVTIVVAGAWGTTPNGIVLAWTLWNVFAVTVLIAGMLYYRHSAATSPPLDSAVNQWRYTHLLIVLPIGISWGMAGALLVPLAPVHNVMIMTAYSGAMAYSAMSMAPNDSANWTASTVFAVICMLLQLPAAFGSHAIHIAGMTILYFFALILAALNARETLITSIELRLSNEALARTNAENAARAEQANRDKSAFLAAASHDLRQPVHALLLLIEAYRQQVPSAAHHPLMQHINSAGQSIRSLFVALMELSQLESGAESPMIASFDLCDVVNNALSSVRPAAHAKALQIRMRMPAARTTLVVCTDRFLLERLIGNLLSNAVKYTASGGVLLTVRRAHGNYGTLGGNGLWLEVWDTGLGISTEDQARIFDPYVQVGNRERDRAKGLGLGLAIVRHTANLLGLTITVQSRPQYGSCFRLHIPANLLSKNVEAAPAATTDAPTLLAPAIGGRRVLLVDDDPLVRQSMQALLQGWQVDLRCAGGGDVTELNGFEDGWVPECILSDFRLPGPMDGIALLDFLLERYPDAVGILQTGELAADVQTRAEEAGYMVLFKPVDPQLLASTLSAILS